MGRMRVLIADDEVHILDMLSSKLRKAGFEVITAQDGVQAYELARSSRPGLIIADYQMPGLSGLELCTKLEADPLTCALPAIILTAHGFDPPYRGVSNPIRDTIAKPPNPREVLELVRTHLQPTPEALAAGV
jgi:two-component system, OmpR family, alkaline phosphatase synthesis response regulator PhoP